MVFREQVDRLSDSKVCIVQLNPGIVNSLVKRALREAKPWFPPTIHTREAIFNETPAYCNPIAAPENGPRTFCARKVRLAPANWRAGRAIEVVWATACMVLGVALKGVVVASKWVR